MSALAELGELRQRRLGSREVRRVDDQPVGQREHLPEESPARGRVPRPPHEHGKVRNEQGDDRGRQSLIGVPTGAEEDLLVRDQPRAVAARQMAVHLDRGVDSFRRPTVGEDDDRARGVTKRELRDALRGAPRMELAVGVHDQVQHGSTRDGAALFPRVSALRAPQSGELPFEFRDARGARSPERGVHVADHALRHSRPSCSIKASASGGPHEPAS